MKARALEGLVPRGRAFEHFILGAQGAGTDLAWGCVDSTEFQLKGFRVPGSGFSSNMSQRGWYGTVQAVLQKIRMCDPTSSKSP